MKVIPSALLLSSWGIVIAQDAAAPVLISSSGADTGSSDPIPAQISFDPDDATPFGETDFAVPELFGGDGSDAGMFGDFGDLLSGIFDGGGTIGAAGDGNGDGQDDVMFGGLNDLLSEMFGGSDSDPDGQGNGILEQLLDASLSGISEPFDLECPSSCDKPDLCQGDLMSLMMGGTDILQEMCDTGCIPIVVLDACGSNADAVDETAGLFIASTGMCDFVNCCVVTEQEETGDAAATTVVVSSTRAKFEECQGKLPEMEDLLSSAVFPLGDSVNTTTTSDLGGPFDVDFDMGDFQDTIEEIVDGFAEVLDHFFGDGMLSEMFANIFDSSSIPAFCAVETCNNAPPGFCDCFSGDLAQCNTEVISQACTTGAFSTCAPEGFTEFCSNECDQTNNGSDILHMCAMCNVVTCCSKDNSEMEGCLSEAFEDHSQEFMDDVDAIFSELEDFLGGMDLEGMMTEVLGDMESMKWCPDDKTCPEPLGQQFCDMANGGPSQLAIDSDIAISPRMGLQSFDLGNMEMDLDKMCSSDMILSCGPVDMKAKCDSVCGADGNDGIMKEAFCHLCGLASCCESGDKTFSECSSAAYVVSSDDSATTNQDEGSTSEPPNEESEVTDEANTASASDGALEADFTAASTEEGEELEGAEPEAAELDPSQITALENSRFEKENSGVTFSSASFFTAIISTGLVLALY
eukprot:CAMPEP_0201689702 /NCGR_PEP_ID=MMETSP0578-20130828/3236_1 /ASSEMBLY_ACC=CAM_ASM_000663 /TAXON_ID=267565 /ORGANISM="Skeletonema grethea, Strain CCMP 1804" /LENGTH=689 /DNA_ID=CAMNT_0048174427 /DNA_START=35 /DNA_END=2107 /DNA_ORIENTATION=+